MFAEYPSTLSQRANRKASSALNSRVEGIAEWASTYWTQPFVNELIYCSSGIQMGVKREDIFLANGVPSPRRGTKTSASPMACVLPGITARETHGFNELSAK